jgi:hypothetical protein
MPTFVQPLCNLAKAKAAETIRAPFTGPFSHVGWYWPLFITFRGDWSL